MSKEQDDLAAAVVTLSIAVTDAAAEIGTLVTKVGVDPAAAESAAVAIGVLAGKLNDAVAAARTAQAVIPPAA